MSYHEFLEREQAIYSEIETSGKKARETGLVSKFPEPGMTESAYIVYLTHSPDVEKQVEEFSSKVVKSVGGRGMRYSTRRGWSKGNIHTTVGLYDKKISPCREFGPDLKVLDSLVDSVQKVMTGGEFIPWLIVHYDRFIHDKSTVLLASTGSEKYFELQDAIAQETERKGLELKKAKMSHITVARIKEDVPAEEMGKFNSLMEGAEIDTNPGGWGGGSEGINFVDGPISVNVGYYQWQGIEKDKEAWFSLQHVASFYFR